MTESGLYPSSLYKKSQNMKRQGLSPSAQQHRQQLSRTSPLHHRGGSGGDISSSNNPRARRISPAFPNEVPSTAPGASTSTSPPFPLQDTASPNSSPAAIPAPSSPITAPPVSRRRRRRPSTALETQTPAPVLVPALPLTSRVRGRFAGRVHEDRNQTNVVGTRRKRVPDGLEGSGNFGGGPGAGGEVTTLEVQRTQWVEGDDGLGGGDVDRAAGSGSACDVEQGPETDDGDDDNSRSESGARGASRGASKGTKGCGAAARERTTTVSEVVGSVCIFCLICFCYLLCLFCSILVDQIRRDFVEICGRGFENCV